MPHWIERPDQLRALVSPVRQEIFDVLATLGPSSVADLARVLGVSADRLYYHIRKMVEVELLVAGGQRSTTRRDEQIYRLAADDMRVRYDAADPENVQALSKAVASMLSLAERDFQRGFRSDLAVVDGPGRNLRAARFKAWLDAEELEEANALLERLSTLFGPGRPGPSRRLYAMAFTLAPLEDQPIRR